MGDGLTHQPILMLFSYDCSQYDTGFANAPTRVLPGRSSERNPPRAPGDESFAEVL
jgi:hypothetical protein